ncbi:MAG: hypothetical protein IBX41_02295 [Methanophagales archaeon]|nr:hypothetical protein [Methanophagales archaeon]
MVKKKREKEEEKEIKSVSEVTLRTKDMDIERLELSSAGKRGLIEALDDKSKAILWYLYQRRHADIEELSRAVSASHYEVLSRLKEVIIPESERIMGKPIVKFEKSKIDRASGEKVLFSWWIDDKVPIIKGGNIDIFDEKDRIVMIADLPGLRLSNPIGISANYNNGILEVVIKKEVKYEG